MDEFPSWKPSYNPPYNPPSWSLRANNQIKSTDLGAVYFAGKGGSIIQMKAIEWYFPVVMLFVVGSNFKPLNET